MSSDYYRSECMEKKIGILSFERVSNRPKGSVGSSRMRVEWPLHHWPEAEEYRIGGEYEVLIYQKVYWDEMMENFKGIQILDLCDPDWLEGRDVMRYIDLVDAVVTSTRALADYILKYRPDKLVRCIPDRVYLPECEPLKEDFSTKKSCVWFGYAHNTKYLIKTLDFVRTWGYRLTIIADQPVTVPNSWADLDVIYIPHPGHPKINVELVKHDFALLPDPSEMDLRGKFKSNNKVTQAWSLNVPVVRVPEDFERFCLTPESRQAEAERARKEIVEKYDVKQSVEEYRKLIEEIKNARRNNKEC